MRHSDGAYPGATEMRYVSNGKHAFLRPRVRSAVRAVRADRNTGVFLTATKLVADMNPKVAMAWQARSETVPALQEGRCLLRLGLGRDSVLFNSFVLIY
jgi:hypothetical protein